MQSGPLSELSSSVQKIQTLLKTKDDTSRFVGLALLKSVLDNSEALRDDQDLIFTLWESIPPKFIDRLLRTGQQGQSASRKNAKDMLDLAVSVLHTFTALVPAEKRDDKFVGRIPRLVASLVQSSDDTTKLVLETLLGLTSQPEGAKLLAHLEDLSPLTEVAPSNPQALEVLSYAWLNSLTGAEIPSDLRQKMDKTVDSLVTSFKGTDAVTLLEFLANLLRALQTPILLENPKWMKPVVDFIRSLVVNRPTAAGRSAYTNLSAALLELYPGQASTLLFSGDRTAEKPFSYLLINLLLVDLRSSFPVLLEQLNNPGYAALSRRLASAFDVVSNFIGYLLRSMDDESAPLIMAPDLLLKIRKALGETMSVTVEYLRDRWDASVAGAMGLHPDARTATANTTTGSRLTLAWDSKSGTTAAEDPLILAAVRTLSIWLREDDSETLRQEATGLTDMLVELYRGGGGSAAQTLDMRRAILVAFEGTTATEEGVAALLEHDGWQVLTADLLSALRSTTTVVDESAAARGLEIVRVLLPVAEAEQPGPHEAWLDVVTGVAAWGVPEAAQPPGVREFQAATLQLVVALLVGVHPSVRRRYTHSISAVLGIATQLKERAGGGEASLVEDMDDVLSTLSSLQ